LGGWLRLVLSSPATQEATAQFAHAPLQHLLHLVGQSAVGQSAFNLIAQGVKFVENLRLIGKTLLQGNTMRNCFGTFIFHELLPLNQNDLKSAPKINKSATSSDCTPASSDA
jgi:hypothetical protein